MQYTSIEQMLQMTRGGTVSGRAPTIIGDQILDAKSGDGPQIDMAKQNLFEAMRAAGTPEPLTPEERTPLTEAELTELSTGDVNAVLASIRAKLIKRRKEGRHGTLKNAAQHAHKAVMSLGEGVLSEMDPDAALDRMADAHGEGDHDEAKEAARDLRDWISKGGFKPKVSSKHHAAIKAHMGGMAKKLLGESNLKPGDMNQGNYADQKPRTIKSGYSTGEFALRTGATKSAGDCSPAKHRGVDAGDPIGETDETDHPTMGDYQAHSGFPSAGGKWGASAAKKGPGGPLRSLQTKADWHAAWKNAAGNPEQMRHLQAIKTKRDPGGKDAGFHDFEIPGPQKNEGVEEAAMSDSENKAGAKAAGERKFDKVWDDVESESKRIAGVASRTGLKAPLKEAIAAFRETVDLSDTLSEYNTAAGKVSGQKVYTDPVATMNINSAYRTELLKLSSGKSAMAGKPGSVKSRGIKPGDPIGEDAVIEGTSVPGFPKGHPLRMARAAEYRDNMLPGMRAARATRKEQKKRDDETENMSRDGRGVNVVHSAGLRRALAARSNGGLS